MAWHRQVPGHLQAQWWPSMGPICMYMWNWYVEGLKTIKMCFVYTKVSVLATSMIHIIPTATLRNNNNVIIA